MFTEEKIEKIKRKFYPEDLNLYDTVNLSGLFDSLLISKKDNDEDINRKIEEFTELHGIVLQGMAERYIAMTRFSTDDEKKEEYSRYLKNVINIFGKKVNEFEKSMTENSHYSNLPDTLDFYKKIIENKISIFCENNLLLQSEEKSLYTEYTNHVSSKTCLFEGKQRTLTQLNGFLEDENRDIRENAWKLKTRMLLELEDPLNELFDRMRLLRNEQGKNMNMESYRDYVHISKNRFDYSPEDIFRFHDSVEKIVLPFIKKINEEKRNEMKLPKLRPWDEDYDPFDYGKLFDNTEEFIDKAIRSLYQINPEFGIRLEKMKNSDFLDLESRNGKSPGGYNYPLSEYGAPFLFMNLNGTRKNIKTIFHESGHAMHTFEKAKIGLYTYRETPSEAAELAAMALEFISMDSWHLFYSDETVLKRAKKMQLANALKFLPWCMTVDAFQQWIYTHENHTVSERNEFFINLMDRFNIGVCWDGLAAEKRVYWLQQLHIFKSPFYYIEYGISQLGALAIYKNYIENREKTLKDYEAFLSAGNSEPLPKLYRTAGIEFRFDEEYIEGIVKFVEEEIKKL